MSNISVASILAAAAETFQERGGVYADNHTRLGNMLAAAFPQGVTLNTPKDHERFALHVLMMVKQTRYAVQFNNGGHQDSIRDTIVYAAMLEATDAAAN